MKERVTGRPGKGGQRLRKACEVLPISPGHTQDDFRPDVTHEIHNLRKENFGQYI